MSIDQLFKKQVPTAEQMRTLLRFVDGGSVASAFGSSKSAQAAATQQLGRIDECMGIRTRKSAGSYKVPTHEARELASIGREYFQKLDDFRTHTERKPNSFVIGAGDSLMFYLLIPALRTADEWKRSVELSLQNLRSREIVNGVLDGSVDVGLVRNTAIDAALTKGKRLRTERIADLEYAFFVNRELVAGYRGDLGDEDALLHWCMNDLPLAVFWGEMSTFTASLGKSKLKWPPQLRCESFPQVKESVVLGGYCGILPTVAFRADESSNIVRFGESLLRSVGRRINLVWSPTLTSRRAGGEHALKGLRSALISVAASSARD